MSSDQLSSGPGGTPPNSGLLFSHRQFFMQWQIMKQTGYEDWSLKRCISTVCFCIVTSFPASWFIIHILARVKGANIKAGFHSGEKKLGLRLDLKQTEAYSQTVVYFWDMMDRHIQLYASIKTHTGFVRVSWKLQLNSTIHCFHRTRTAASLTVYSCFEVMAGWRRVIVMTNFQHSHVLLMD